MDPNPNIKSSDQTLLNLRCGEFVKVKSEDEILATLDEFGDCDGLPFMPEMRRYCGQQFRVERRADKSCDTISGDIVGRRMRGAVHLERLRCDGEDHRGCQAGCLIYWKEAWLERVEAPDTNLLWNMLCRREDTSPHSPPRPTAPLTRDDVEKATVSEINVETGHPRYRCQVTKLLDATEPLAWNDWQQYLRDWLSGNVSLPYMLRIAVLRITAPLVYGRGFSLRVKFYDALARIFGEPLWPFHPGRAKSKTPRETLDLKPGDLVTVKSHSEILDTINSGWSNRGLGFAPEMVRYCGGTYRVQARVEKILDEKTGEMVYMRNDCIILQDVTCRSECSTNRLFCPRGIYPFWREIWLRRAED